jgi:succinoglycan biosynthesis protein ExoW
VVHVIIPYFQKQHGILAKALRSVFAQRGIRPENVVVIDDQSPVSARSEIVSLGFQLPVPLTIVDQANAGPGAARNRGLDSVPGSVKYVAFLDSDDEWSEDHLANACEALDAGFDCYFANHLQVGQSVGSFERARRIEADLHPRISGNPALHAYHGDMLDRIITGNVIGTSTVVYNFQKYREVRFHRKLRSAGEDYLFWMTLAARGAKFAFSSKIEAVYGRGVNVYSGSGWGTEGHLLRIQNEMQFRKLTKETFALSASQSNFVDQQIQTLRLACVRDILHRLMHFHPISVSLLRSQARVDLETLLAFPLLALKVALEGHSPKSGQTN